MTTKRINKYAPDTIIHGDCLSVMRDIPSGSVDLVITSPPYNMRTRIRNGQYTTRERSEAFSKKYRHFSDDLPIEEFYEFHSKVLGELLRVSKVVCYNFQIVTGSKEAFFRMMGDFSTKIKDIIIWDKGHGQPAIHEHVLNSCYELILVLENDNLCGRVIQGAKFPRGEMNNILRIKHGESVTDEHTAVFPIELAEKIINAFTIPGDIVLDCFMGLGSTAIAAVRTGRHYLGCDISEEYCRIAERRVANAVQQITIGV